MADRDRFAVKLQAVPRTREKLEGFPLPIEVYGGDLLYVVTVKDASEHEVEEMRDVIEDLMRDHDPRPTVLVTNCEIDVEILEVVERSSRYEALSKDG